MTEAIAGQMKGCREDGRAKRKDKQSAVTSIKCRTIAQKRRKCVGQ